MEVWRIAAVEKKVHEASAKHKSSHQTPVLMRRGEPG